MHSVLTEVSASSSQVATNQAQINKWLGTPLSQGFLQYHKLIFMPSHTKSHRLHGEEIQTIAETVRAGKCWCGGK